MPRRIDLTGQKFGRLKVLKFAGTTKGHSQWLCECECGMQKVIRSSHLKTGHTKSCGCLNTQRIREGELRKHPLYSTWFNMKNRCFKTNNPAYKYYGGIGRTMWSEWRDNSKLFLNYVDCHLGPKPGPKYTIDRIDNDGNYEPYNIRWATPKGQIDNRRPRAVGISGYPWVRVKKNRYVGRFRELGNEYTCGTYDTPEEAYEAVLCKRRGMGLKVPE